MSGFPSIAEVFVVHPLIRDRTSAPAKRRSVLRLRFDLTAAIIRERDSVVPENFPFCNVLRKQRSIPITRITHEKVQRLFELKGVLDFSVRSIILVGSGPLAKRSTLNGAHRRSGANAPLAIRSTFPRTH